MSVELRITGETLADAVQQILNDSRLGQAVKQKPQTETAAPLPQTAATPFVAPPSAPLPQTDFTAPPVQAAPGPIPTAAPTYSLAEISKAGADLTTAQPNKMQDLLNLLERYGVRAITELKPEQMSPFVAELRGLGAKI